MLLSGRTAPQQRQRGLVEGVLASESGKHAFQCPLRPSPNVRPFGQVIYVLLISLYLHVGPALCAHDLCSHTGPCLSKGAWFGLMFCCCHLEFLVNFA